MDYRISKYGDQRNEDNRRERVMKQEVVYRLSNSDNLVNESIDRSTPLWFEFNGRSYRGFLGDTLASALLANGVHMVGRSFKYHRPRGIMSAGAEETNAIVQLIGDDDEPNVLATTLQLYDGLNAKSVNCYPSLSWDFGVLNEWLNRFFPAGFYYKTFMWPKDQWDLFGRFIRRVAGWGVVPNSIKENRYEHRSHHCDVLIVGAGPAGLSAALFAGRAGARVMLVDNQPEPGGDLLNTEYTINNMSGRSWVTSIVEELEGMENVKRVSSAIASGYYDHNFLTVLEENPTEQGVCERLWKIRAKQVVLATGALERPLAFADNDRPGIMLASSISAYCSRYAVNIGQNIVLFTNNNSAYSTAFKLVKAGAHVEAIVDLRKGVDAGIKRTVKSVGIKVFENQQIKKVYGTKHICRVAIGAFGSDEITTLDCDLLGVSGGWNPTIHLHSQSGGRPQYSESIASFVPGDSVQAEISAGACKGLFTLSDCLSSGFEAGVLAAEACGFHGKRESTPECVDEFALDITAVWQVPLPHKGARAFLDFNNDVTTKDINLAVREGYASVELVKRYTTAGMGIDQGKTGNVNIIGYLSECTKTPPGSIGTTTYRPSYSPISFGAMAGANKGNLLIPWRRTEVTQWFIDNGGHLDETGAFYRRPLFIPREGENARAAMEREAVSVRTGVGIYDSSPLGKIDIKGPDAVKFLNRLYTNAWDKLEVGSAKFGYMLYDDGRLMDDGVTCRIAEEHYLMTTGSGVADVVLRHIDYLLNCVWTDLKVYITPVTDNWTVLCVCGPKSREFLQNAGTDLPIFDKKYFPFMASKTGRVAGLDVRVNRVGYTGELSFEIFVRARDGRQLWDKLIEAGKEFDITPVGSDTSMLLRTEKAFIAAGLEGDGYANIYDVGLGWVVNNKKGDFIGKRSTERDLSIGGDRPQVVGLKIENKTFVAPKGCPIVDPNMEGAKKMEGMVTIGFFSPNLNESIALAQLKNGRARMGEQVILFTKEQELRATVCDPIFIDPTGERMRS